MANEIYDSTWWGNTIETASSIGTSTEMIQGQFNMLTSNQPNLVVNGDFKTDSDWTNFGVWTISNGKANNNGSSSGDLKQVLSMSLNVGSFYVIQFTVSNYISGLFDINIGGNTNTIDVSSDGIFKYTLELTSAPNNNILLRPRPNFNGSIDNVSVKEVRATTVEASKCLADAIHRIGIQNIQN